LFDVHGINQLIVVKIHFLKMNFIVPRLVHSIEIVVNTLRSLWFTRVNAVRWCVLGHEQIFSIY